MVAKITREGWLEKAVTILRKSLFAPAGLEVPEVRVSVGWPSRGALSLKNRTIGQCWYGTTTGDEIPQIFISPVLDTPDKVLATLVHELLHATFPPEVKHGPRFAKAMRQVGLEGKPTATHAGVDLAEDLKALASKLGDFPHAKISATGPGPKQSTRLIKTECPDCGYIARVTAKWLDEVGPVICPLDEVEFLVAG